VIRVGSSSNDDAFSETHGVLVNRIIGIVNVIMVTKIGRVVGAVSLDSYP